MKHLLRITMICLLIGGTSVAKAETTGPAIGAEIQHDLAVLDQHNNEQSFQTLVGEKGLVLFFVRSADWCPYCRIQMLDLNKRASEFTDLGYTVATVSYDDVDALAKFSDRYKITYPLLSDSGSEIIKSFGILNTEKQEGEFGYGIPHPGVFVIYPDKKIGVKYFEEGYKERPDLDVILEDLAQE